MDRTQHDEELVKSYLDGDEEALKPLFKRYLRPLYNFVFQYVSSRHDAEDVTQEAFVKAWRHLEKFDPKRSFKTWLFSIAKNAAIDFLKKKKILPFSALENGEGSTDAVAGIADAADLPDEIFRRADAAKILNKAVSNLPAPYRAVLFLYYRDGFNFREISEALDESIDTVKSRHRRAIALLKKAISKLN